MSAKSTKTPKKLSVPREMADIQKEYQQACVNAGQIQYQISVLKSELDKTNDHLRSLNNEAAARNQLDKAAPKTETTEA